MERLDNTISYSKIIKSFKDSRTLLLMFLPGLAFYIIFCYVPMYGIIIAFKDYSFSKGIIGSDWIGMRHFINFFNHPYFFRLLRNTVLISVYSLLFAFPAPIIFALLLNECRIIKYKRIIQSVSYLPYFISTVVVVSIIVNMLSPSNGIINIFLNKTFGISPIYFMNDPKWFRFIYIGSGIWQGLGWNAIIYIAALSQIDQDLYEAAYIDGANRMQSMFHITLPSISSTIIILLILNIGSLLAVGFEKIILMYTPATYETADVISTYIFRRGIQNAEFSFATAISVINNIFNFMLLVFANKLAKTFSSTSLW